MPIIALALVPALLHWPALLLPMHIVLLELIINPACSIIFEAEPGATDLMQRPPRDLHTSPFSLHQLGQGLLQGAGIAMILLGMYGWLLARHGAGVRSSSLIVLMLLLSVFLLILANRDRARPALSGLFSQNRWVMRLALIMILLLGLLMWLRPLGAVMGTMAPAGADFMLAVVGIVLMLQVCIQCITSCRLNRNKRALAEKSGGCRWRIKKRGIRRVFSSQIACLFEAIAHTQRHARAVLTGKQELLFEAAVTPFSFVVQVDAF